MVNTGELFETDPYVVELSVAVDDAALMFDKGEHGDCVMEGGPRAVLVDNKNGLAVFRNVSFRAHDGVACIWKASTSKAAYVERFASYAQESYVHS